jgi:hypothetical protein
LISRHFWWPGIKQFVKDHVRKCDICQRNKPRNCTCRALVSLCLCLFRVPLRWLL